MVSLSGELQLDRCAVNMCLTIRICDNVVIIVVVICICTYAPLAAPRGVWSLPSVPVILVDIEAPVVVNPGPLCDSAFGEKPIVCARYARFLDLQRACQFPPLPARQLLLL